MHVFRKAVLEVLWGLWGLLCLRVWKVGYSRLDEGVSEHLLNPHFIHLVYIVLHKHHGKHLTSIQSI